MNRTERSLKLAPTNKIAANNRSRKHHVYAQWAQPLYIYLNTKLLKAPIGQKWCHLCRLGLWKPLDGDPRKLQNPAQSAKGEQRRDRERNPWLANMFAVWLLERESSVYSVRLTLKKEIIVLPVLYKFNTVALSLATSDKV